MGQENFPEKHTLLNALEELINLAGRQENRFAAELLQETKERFEKETFTLVILGEFKRGKSTFVNALLGEPLLPTAIVPLTAIPTIIHYQEHPGAQVVFLNGERRVIELEAITAFVTEKENPANRKQVREVQVGYASPFLRRGVILVDTPGVGSVYEHNTGAAYAYLPRSDAGIFLLSVDAPLSKTEIDYLKDVRQHVHKLFFVVNKIDVVSGSDVEEALEFLRGTLRNIFDGQETMLFPLSARLALEGKRENNRQKIAASGIPELEEKLNSFIEQNKVKLIREITAARALRIAGELELALLLWRRAMEETEQDLSAKIARFNQELARLEQEREDSIYLLYREVDRLRKEVEENMALFRRENEGNVVRQLEEFAAGLQARSPREAAHTLKQQVQEIVRAAIEPKRVAEREELQEKFKAVAVRFFNRIENIVDQLMDVSAEIFQVAVEKTASKEYILGKRGFYFHFADHPTFVPPLEDLPAMGILPGGLLRRHLVNRS
ncbi:MAG: dynamin family protein, partial [Armatimonadetes bacterium]|nr:dynamin family protein [Armatimonadota bacterium]